MKNGHYITDYHCHSTISPDGRNTMLEMAEAAIEKGIDNLCFTDHIEPLPWIKWNDPPLEKGSFDWDAMLAQFREAQEKCGERITLRMGAELGEVTFAQDVEDSFLDMAPPLDFTIGSVHTYLKADGMINDLCWLPKEGADEAYWHDASERYLAEMEKLIDWGRFHVLGHLTLPMRYALERSGLLLDFGRYEEQVRHILRRAIDRGLGIECNTNRGGIPLPEGKWLRLYRELGGEIITLGSDAHTPNYLGCAMVETQELLKDCGLKYFCTFTRGRPEFHKI